MGEGSGAARREGLHVHPSEDHEELRRLARRVADREIRPVAAQYDQSREFPWPVLERIHTAGLFDLQIPAPIGGAGLTAVEECIVQEELAAGCAGISLALVANTLALTPILIAGTPEQQSALLGPFTRQLRLAAFGLTEAQAGSDAGALKTRARREGDAYILDGRKRFITNGGVADLYTIFATLDGTPQGITCFAVERGTDGLSAGREERKLGIRASNTSEVVLDGVRVPAAMRIGGEGEGYRIALRTLGRSRATIAAAALGIAREALGCAVRYARERQQFSRPIAQLGAIEQMLGEMAMRVEASRLLVYQAAEHIAAGETSPLYSSMAKAFAADTAMFVAGEAVQIFGGYGYMEDYPVEKLFRDAKIYQIFEGTNQVQRMVIARTLVRGDE